MHAGWCPGLRHSFKLKCLQYLIRNAGLRSSFIAAAGTPVICGVGPVGGNYHRPDEWMQVDSLSERARFIAKTIQKLAEKTTNSSL